MKLKDVFNEIAAWFVAVHVAKHKGIIDWFEADDKINQIRVRAREWIGEDLLETKI